MATQLPLPMPQLPPVHRGISWVDLFGRSMNAMTGEMRKARWEELKALSRTDEERRLVEYYENPDGCDSDGRGMCRHFQSGWCTTQDLPAGFNPLMQCLGMACMGMGYKPARKGGA